MIFEASQRTPQVELTPTSCLIRGECYPENISEWSDPILKALEECLGNDESAYVVDIELYYFNSSSAKFLFDFFEFLEESAEGGKNLRMPQQRNGHISTPRRPLKLSIGPSCTKNHGGGLGTTPSA